MDYFRNLLIPPPQVDMSEDFQPEWQALFAPGDYFDFLGMLLAYLRRMQMEYSLKKDALILNAGDQKIDLEALARACSQQRRGQWRETIAAYFRSPENPPSKDLDFSI